MAEGERIYCQAKGCGEAIPKNKSYYVIRKPGILPVVFCGRCFEKEWSDQNYFLSEGIKKQAEALENLLILTKAEKERSL